MLKFSKGEKVVILISVISLLLVLTACGGNRGVEEEVTAEQNANSIVNKYLSGIETEDIDTIRNCLSSNFVYTDYYFNPPETYTKNEFTSVISLMFTAGWEISNCELHNRTSMVMDNTTVKISGIMTEEGYDLDGYYYITDDSCEFTVQRIGNKWYITKFAYTGFVTQNVGEKNNKSIFKKINN